MKGLLVLFMTTLLLCSACANANPVTHTYQQISQQEAKIMMDTQDVLILDVREQDEYDAGHIPGAVLFPVGTITESTASSLIPRKDTVILVYCRSGNRSKTASDTLVKLGYTKVYEFGGINTWPYDVEYWYETR